MLVVRVELWPSGGGRAHEVARAEISNASDLAKLSDYQVEVSEEPNMVTFRGAWEAEGKIAGHDREQTVWALIAKAAAIAATAGGSPDFRQSSCPHCGGDVVGSDRCATRRKHHDHRGLPA